MFELKPELIDLMDTVSNGGKTFDLSDLEIRFAKIKQAGITNRNRIKLDTEYWAKSLDGFGRLDLLAHEATHSVQYRSLGRLRFWIRYSAEWARLGEGRYEQPAQLRGPISGLNFVDKRYALDAIEDRVADATVSRYRR